MARKAAVKKAPKHAAETTEVLKNAPIKREVPIAKYEEPTHEKAPAVKKVGSSSSAAIAIALAKHFPGKGKTIISVMSEAARTSKSWQRKLARLSEALAKTEGA